MSAQVNTYVMYGYKLEYGELFQGYEEEDKENAQERLWDNAFKDPELGKVYLVSDGMCGEYEVLGVIKERTGIYDQGLRGFADLKVTAKEKRALKSFVEKHFKEVLDGKKPEVLVFTHYR